MMRAAKPLGTDDGYNFLRINHRDPVGIKYWEVGNETFGTGYYDGGDGYAVNYAVPYDGTERLGNTNLSPAFYGRQVSIFSQMMKAVDPTIKIGAVVDTPPDDYSGDTFDGQLWTPQALAQCASNIDFVIAHWYPYAGNGANGSSLLSQVGSTIPVMINGTATHTNTDSGLRDWINDYRSDGTNVQIFITEFNYLGSLAVSNNSAPVSARPMRCSRRIVMRHGLIMASPTWITSKWARQCFLVAILRSCAARFIMRSKPSARWPTPAMRLSARVRIPVHCMSMRRCDRTESLDCC